MPRVPGQYRYKTENEIYVTLFIVTWNVEDCYWNFRWLSLPHLNENFNQILPWFSNGVKWYLLECLRSFSKFCIFFYWPSPSNSKLKSLNYEISSKQKKDHLSSSSSLNSCIYNLLSCIWMSIFHNWNLKILSRFFLCSTMAHPNSKPIRHTLTRYS